MNTAPISASQTSARMAVRPRPPALLSDAPSLIAVAEIDRARHVGAGLLAHQVGEPARHLALVRLRKRAEQHVGDDQPEHVVAEKFEPLIAAGAVARAGQGGDVGERLLEQRSGLEPVADAVFELKRADAAAPLGFRLRLFRFFRLGGSVSGGKINRLAAGRRFGRWRGNGCSFAFALAAHRTIVNSRLQRTVQGQRQISQACSPSPIEKKMIWARPTMFSNGT